MSTGAPYAGPMLKIARYREGTAMPAHAHDEPWLCLLLEGGYSERILTRTTEHAPGALLFCPAHTPHAQRIGREGAVKLLVSPSAAALAYLRDQRIALDDAPSTPPSPLALRLGCRLRREIDVGDVFAPLVAHGLVLELVAAFGRARSARWRGRPPAWLRQVRDQLRDDPAAPLDLGALAQLAQRHPVHLVRAFRGAFGCTPGEFVRRARIERAASLLRTTRRSLLDIALDCGYASAAHFSRSFRAALAMTPSAYRAERTTMLAADKRAQRGQASAGASGYGGRHVARP
jgi:AraC family transcriptional regulator